MTSDEWEQIERSIVRNWTAGQVQAARDSIRLALDSGTPEQRGRALMYRGSIEEEACDWKAACVDFVDATALLPTGSYSRYVAELSAARAYEHTKRLPEAKRCYRAAMATFMTANELFSGATAGRALLDLDGQLDASDRQLIIGVIEKSWQMLGLPERPELSDLKATLELLVRQGSGPDTVG